MIGTSTSATVKVFNFKKDNKVQKHIENNPAIAKKSKDSKDKRYALNKRMDSDFICVEKSAKSICQVSLVVNYTCTLNILQ